MGKINNDRAKKRWRGQLRESRYSPSKNLRYMERGEPKVYKRLSKHELNLAIEDFNTLRNQKNEL